MKNIPIWVSDYIRQVGKAPSVLMKNRFLEKNPVLSDQPVAAISRPVLKKIAEVGSGPIRKVFSAPGVFDGDLFVVSGTALYRVAATTLAPTLIGAIGTNPIGDISMAATAPFEGSTGAMLYVAEGGVLYVYTDNGHAMAFLQASGAIANNDTVQLGTVYYKWTTGSLAGGTGASGTPWLVKLGASNSEAMKNLYEAVNAKGIDGTTYTAGLTAHASVVSTKYSATDIVFEALLPGVNGNALASTETGLNLSFAGATFSGGGTNQLRQVMLPDDNGAVSVASINSYVIVIPVQGKEIKGRFYWIEPGERTIDALNFATAERNPDGLHQVLVYGDMFWLLGENTTEPWITTGDPVAPMERYKGILFDRGSWQGTAVQVKDSLIVVDEDGGVFQISGGQKRISRPDIEERIRRAIQRQGAYGY